MCQVKAIMKQRLNALRDICQMFLDGVINSMNNLPYGIRWICKQIKNLSIVITLETFYLIFLVFLTFTLLLAGRNDSANPLITIRSSR